MFDPATSDLTGVPTATLQQWLADAQQAFHDITVGGKPMVVTVRSAVGAERSVTYTRSSLANLTAYIQALKAQLGITRRIRRAIPGTFG